ncbi:MAG: ABC transporter ATP-binding protein [Alistipes sp.]|nr:ABC transporter ATP-binding protein [Alistipes sp.]
MIRLENISLAYDGHTIIRESSAQLGRGELCALIGRNGTGKSTLLRAIIGLLKTSEGRILLDDEDVTTMADDAKARLISFVSTERIRVANLLCEDVVATGRAPYTNWIGRIQEQDRKIVAEALRTVGMETFAGRSIDTLSYGECQRIMIARALAQQTPIILLDEPTAFLDIPARFELCRLLRRLAQEQQKCILFSTHDIDAALPSCDSTLIIEEGVINKVAIEQAKSVINTLFGI